MADKRTPEQTAEDKQRTDEADRNQTRNTDPTRRQFSETVEERKALEAELTHNYGDDARIQSAEDGNNGNTDKSVVGDAARRAVAENKAEALEKSRKAGEKGRKARDDDK